MLQGQRTQNVVQERRDAIQVASIEQPDDPAKAVKAGTRAV
jgi:hypothetical protein